MVRALQPGLSDPCTKHEGRVTLVCVGHICRNVHVPVHGPIRDQKVVNRGVQETFGGYIEHWVRAMEWITNVKLEVMFPANIHDAMAFKNSVISPHVTVRHAGIAGKLPIAVVLHDGDVRDIQKQPSLPFPEVLTIPATGDWIVMGNVSEAVLDKALDSEAAHSANVISFGCGTISRQTQARIPVLVVDVAEAQQLVNSQSTDPAILARHLFETVRESGIGSPMRCVTGGGSQPTALIFRRGLDIVMATIRPVPVMARCGVGAGDIFTLHLLNEFVRSGDWSAALRTAAFGAATYVAGCSRSDVELRAWMDQMPDLTPVIQIVSA